MMTRRATIFAATTLVAAIVAIHLWQQLRTERALTAQLQDRIAQQAMSQPADRQDTPAPAAPPPLAENPPAALAAPPAVADAVVIAAPTATGAVANAPSCETQQAQMRQTAARMHADAITEMNLAAAESEALVDLLATQIAGPASWIACRSSDGSTLGAQAFQRELQFLLGPVRFEQFEELQAARAARQNIDTLGNQLAPTDFPLSEDQRHRLQETIVAEQRRSRMDLASLPLPIDDPRAQLQYEEDVVKVTQQRFDRVLAAVQSYLSPPQIAMLESNLTRQQAAARAQIAVRRAQLDAGGNLSQSAPVLLVPPR